jgi:hypothetical protein
MTTVDDAVTLAAVIHGESGAGKSTLGGTTPIPRLVADAEGGSRYVKAHRRRIKWNPLQEPVPEWDGSWDTCIVTILDWQTLYAMYEHLSTGNHPFRSLIIDSLTEAQKRLVDDVAGTDQPTLQDWGTIGRNFEDMIRRLRDLTFHPIKPIEAVVMICLSHLRDGETRPFLKGQIELTLPAFVDVVGYLYTDTQSGAVARRLLIEPANNIIAKDRTGALLEKYGPVVTDANVSEWLEILQEEFGLVD